jgi:hypothetical protein
MFDDKSIPAFHNDLIADGKRYHVLTEDLGREQARIVTQAFAGGLLLETRKTEYPAVEHPEELRAAVQALMQRQHRAMMHKVVNTTGVIQPDPTPRPTLIVRPVLTPRGGTSDFGARNTVHLVAPEEAAHIEVVSGAFAGQRFALHCSPLSLGRSASITLEDPSVDPMQCVFFRYEEGWRIVANPLGSGIFVNERRCDNKLLAHEDLIRVGHFDVRFLEVSRIGTVILEKPSARGTLLPLVAQELDEPHENFESRVTELEERLAALAVFGPKSTPILFSDRDAQLAYGLNAFVALASLALLRARRQRARGEKITALDLRTNIDSRRSGLVDLDAELCTFEEQRIFAAVRLALRTCNVNPPFTADDLELRLDEAMRNLINDPSLVRIDHKNHLVMLPAAAWPFRTPIETLVTFATASRRAQFAIAQASQYSIAFG